MKLQGDTIRKILYFFATTLILVAPALYNRYPLVYFDSGAYMEMAVSLEPSFHRSLGYPFLMRLTGWIISNWPIVILQGLLVNVLIFRFVQIIRSEKRFEWHFISIVLLSFGSALSWYAAQLMPDIFTFILALTMILVAIERTFDIRKTVFYGILLLVTIPTHLSHFPLLILMLFSVAILGLKWSEVRWSRLKWITTAGSLIIALISTASYNAYHGHGYRLSLASSVFMAANIGEMGYLKLYLDENCSDESLIFCDIKDSLPLETGGYLWAGDGPIQTFDGGWSAANEACQPIVHDFLTKPRYAKWYLFGSLKAWWKQMFQIELGSGLQYTYADGSPPSWPMHSHFKQELNEYLTSVQNKDASHLPLDFFKKVHYLSLLLTMLIIGLALIRKKVNGSMLVALLIAVLFYVYNAAITGILANVYERLQVRLLPLFMLVAILLFLQSKWVRTRT